MAERESEDTYLDRPNRRKASSKATKAIVALLLVVSAVIVIVIAIGGWDTLEGAKPLQIAYIVIYLVMAFLVMRWNRGVLPLAAALAIVLLIFAAVSGPRVVRPRQDRPHRPGPRRGHPRPALR